MSTEIRGGVQSCVCATVSSGVLCCLCRALTLQLIFLKLPNPAILADWHRTSQQIFLFNNTVWKPIKDQNQAPKTISHKAALNASIKTVSPTTFIPNTDHLQALTKWQALLYMLYQYQVIKFSPLGNLTRLVWLPLCYRWGLWGLENLTNFPRVTEPASEWTTRKSRQYAPESLLLTTLGCFLLSKRKREKISPGRDVHKTEQHTAPLGWKVNPENTLSNLPGQHWVEGGSSSKYNWNSVHRIAAISPCHSLKQLTELFQKCLLPACVGVGDSGWS